MDIRYRTLARATIANGATQIDTLATPDDNRRRRVTGVYSVDQTAGAITSILRTGYDAGDFANSQFDATFGWQELDLLYDPGIQIQFQTANNSGGSLTTPIVAVRYELE